MARGQSLRLEDMRRPTAYDDSPIWDIDRRTKAFRRLVQSVSDIYSDLGGIDHLSFSQKALAEQLALYREWLNIQWQKWMQGQDIDMAEVVKVTNSMRNIASQLGLERQARNVPSLEDLTEE